MIHERWLDAFVIKFERLVHRYTTNHFPTDDIKWDISHVSRQSTCKFCHKKILERSDGSWFNPEHPENGLIERKKDRNHEGIM